MVTTNLASGRLASTYVDLRSECEALLEIAKEIEICARNNEFDSADFQKRKAAFTEALAKVITLSSC